MPKITINGKEVEFQKGMTVLQACEIADVEVPRFCYHEKLSIAGNCRMCLVEMERSPKPIASCAMPAAEGMNIKTNTEFVKKARKGIMEFLLANHPLDCPVCDQGGECDLQDQSLFYGLDKSRFSENKREVKDKYMGPLIKTQMTRCIHCTRCIRFAEEVAGVPEIGAIGRGENMEITTYLEQSMTSELSANVIDLCPVGALTSKPYAFEARPWELKKTESVDVMDAVGSNIRVDTYGWEVKRILPRLNNEINEEWISDKTRYACDGLLKQRLDIPYIRKNGRLIKSNWDDALELITEKIKSLNPEEIGAHIGDMTSIETIFAFKTLLKKINCNNYDFREKNFYINPSNKENYIFNTSIQSIEESDLILLIGCNPRHEATIINARIRKAFVKNKTPIFSIGNPGDLTYEYILLGDDTIDLKNIFDGKSKINENLKNSKKPLFIIGESTLELKNAQCIFEKTKNFLIKNNFTNDTWNAFNILTQNASTVGAIDLGFYNVKEKNNFIFFDKLKNKDFKLLYLVGSDNLEIEKSGEFIIYQGSHGDRNAEIADVILPSPSYTEQDGLFENLEGRIQECRKASYPTNDALEDWKIFNLINNSLNKVNLFDNFLSIRELAIKEIPNFSEIGLLPKKNKISSKESLAIISNEKIKIKPIDYYFSNSIARASKTMSDCRNVIYNNKKNGTNN
jgi:NADH-quinone oxidoreductase subunit G